MATIKRTDRGQIVQHGYGYYYTADDFGQPCSGGYTDLADAETALELDDCDHFPEPDFALDGKGNPEDADADFARVQWDEECDDEEFNEAFPAFLNDSTEDWDDQIWSLARADGFPMRIWIPVAEAKRLEAAVAMLPGWGEGPDSAPSPLLFFYPESEAN